MTPSRGVPPSEIKKVTVMSKKVSVFEEKIEVTLSVAAPGDTNPSDEVKNVESE